MNNCVLEVEVKKPPTIRYTQDNKTPIAEMEVQFKGLRADDPPGDLKVVGWGNMAQDLQNNIKTGQRLVLEGRLRMNTIPRQDGTKEKRAELTISRYHQCFEELTQQSPNIKKESKETKPTEPQDSSWNSAPLVPDTDEIPF